MTSLSPIPLSEFEQIVQLQKELAWAVLKIQVLEERLRLERIKKYGPGSEKLNDAQLQLLDLEPGVSNAEVQTESEREPLPSSEKQQQRRKHPGRQQLPARLPRVERVIACMRAMRSAIDPTAPTAPGARNRPNGPSGVHHMARACRASR